MHDYHALVLWYLVKPIIMYHDMYDMINSSMRKCDIIFMIRCMVIYIYYKLEHTLWLMINGHLVYGHPILGHSVHPSMD